MFLHNAFLERSFLRSGNLRKFSTCFFKNWSNNFFACFLEISSLVFSLLAVGGLTARCWHQTAKVRTSPPLLRKQRNAERVGSSLHGFVRFWWSPVVAVVIDCSCFPLGRSWTWQFASAPVCVCPCVWQCLLQIFLSHACRRIGIQHVGSCSAYRNQLQVN